MNGSGISARGVIRFACWVALAAWTGYWIVAGWAYLQEHSLVVRYGFGGDGVQLWEIFDIKMIVLHQAMRWGGGVLVVAPVLYLLRPRRAAPLAQPALIREAA